MAKKRKKKKSPVGYVLYLVIIIIGCFLAYKAFSVAFGYGKGISSQNQTDENKELGEEIYITIPQGATTGTIADVLKENGLIDNKLMFKISSRMNGYDGTYRHGNYYIAKGHSDEEIMKILQSGIEFSDAIKVTIPEGYTAMQIGKALEKAGVISYDDFIYEMNNGEFNYDFLKDVPKRDFYLEGYLFPATYNFRKDAGANEIITQFLERFNIAYANILKNNTSKYTYDQIVTVASLIESEIQVDEERPRAAGVIYNRLKNNMLLQIDSTVQYALSTRNEVVTLNDLEVDSPYNTYKNKGLPSGPICNPGDEALKAAVNPENNNFIYYVVKTRGSGEHVFAETYDEFLQAKKAYQNSFN